MKSLALALFLFGSGLPQQASEDEAWEELAAIHDEAVSLWVTAMVGPAAGEDPDGRPAHPAVELWPEFAALAEAGDERAILWLLVNLDKLGGAEARAREAGRVLGWVERAGDAPWVAEALPELTKAQASLDGERLAVALETCMESERSELRVVSMVCLAQLLAADDPDLAREMHLEAARLWWDAARDSLEPASLDELAAALADELRRRDARWFQEGHAPTPDDVYFPSASARPSPELTFRPLLLALAEAGSSRARLWVLENTYAQVEADRELLRRHLAALAETGLDARALAGLRYRASSLARQLGTAFVEAQLLRLIERVDEAERAGLLLGLGVALCESAEGNTDARERGLVLLHRVIERWPGSDEAQEAAGKSFRFERLRVGQVAPDIETVDVDGTPFRLSDYRGKVTVLDFWGFW